MDWSADVTISGTLASVGARLIEGTANKMIGQTFECIRVKLETPGSRDGVAGPARWRAVAGPRGAVGGREGRFVRLSRTGWPGSGDPVGGCDRT